MAMATEMRHRLLKVTATAMPLPKTTDIHMAENLVMDTAHHQLQQYTRASR
jgi:hypothetical protein